MKVDVSGHKLRLKGVCQLTRVHLLQTAYPYAGPGRLQIVRLSPMISVVSLKPASRSGSQRAWLSAVRSHDFPRADSNWARAPISRTLSALLRCRCFITNCDVDISTEPGSARTYQREARTSCTACGVGWCSQIVA